MGYLIHSFIYCKESKFKATVIHLIKRSFQPQGLFVVLMNGPMQKKKKKKDRRQRVIPAWASLIIYISKILFVGSGLLNTTK